MLKNTIVLFCFVLFVFHPLSSLIIVVFKNNFHSEQECCNHFEIIIYNVFQPKNCKMLLKTGGFFFPLNFFK